MTETMTLFVYGMHNVDFKLETKTRIIRNRMAYVNYFKALFIANVIRI